MSKKAKALLKKAIELYKSDDDATDSGAYRDAITDICHLAMESGTNFPWTNDLLSNIRMTLDEGFSVFEEETENQEHNKIMNTPAKDLPLHIGDKYLFESNREYFEERLKHDGEKSN